MPTAQQSVHLIAATIGFAALALIWLGVLWGVVLRSGWALTRIRHATMYGVHQTVTLLGLCLGVVHALAQLAAPAGTVRWMDELVPFVNPFDPIGLGMGVLALELMLSFALSVLIQRRLGYHRWRTLHSFAYVAFTLLVGHVLVSGSDVGSAAVRGLVVAGWLSVVGVWVCTLPGAAKATRTLLHRGSARVQATQVTVNVDPGKCVRFGFCEHEAPEVFRLRSDGRLAYRPSVPADKSEDAVQAALVCPARAITLGRLPTSVLVAPAVESPLEATGRHHYPPIRAVHDVEPPGPQPLRAADGAGRRRTR